ncbi:GDSL-type esterase/lipase family protein [Nocardia goodfellowii]|uniref:Lysophospholipase L1-like esterase n=1 Tax=Nocardia goodfellowii TaxID=882446 RepID=A0ABS4QE40_9NOCA|nr:GDSL-type esterase/lipase family protein [Nocardia goodfellowii]MBP2188951.1 lysophospholipase L1-like esterase [Nocardia goodfellowii]
MSNWVAGFRSAVISPYEQIKLADSRAFADQTLRQVLRLAGGGEQLRVRLTNRYGREPLVVGAVRVAERKVAAEIVAETDRPVLFDGADRLVIPVGEEAVSDPVDLVVTAGTDLLLSIYLPEPTGLATFSHQPIEIAYLTTGNETAALAPSDIEEIPARFFVTGVDVRADGPVIVAFGDSWFEGVGTTLGANHRSVDYFNQRLTDGWAVNQGIAANRLLTTEVGEPGLARFDRDVLAVPGVTRVLVNFGINDLILGGMAGQPSATAAELIAGFTELAERAHAAGLTIHAATIGPYAGCVYPGLPIEESLPTRRAVNEWLRATDVFDAIFDVAAAVADPARPDFIRPEFDSGDGMHLNDAGAHAMAATIPLA